MGVYRCVGKFISWPRNTTTGYLTSTTHSRLISPVVGNAMHRCWTVYQNYIPLVLYVYLNILFQFCFDLSRAGINASRESITLCWVIVHGHRSFMYWLVFSLDSVTWWRHQMEPFSRHCPFVRRTHRSPVDSPHKGQWQLWCFTWCASGQTVEQTVEMPVIWDTMVLIVMSLWWLNRNTADLIHKGHIPAFEFNLICGRLYSIDTIDYCWLTVGWYDPTEHIA